MSDAPLTAEQEAAARRVQKLLALSSNNPNEHEAAAAAAQAQELLVRYNLDSATAEAAAGASGRREKAAVEGGYYAYQRELWDAVAQLNFCLYWSQVRQVRGNWRVSDGCGGRVRVPGYRAKRQHLVVGRVVNARLSVEMARYLEGAVERVATELLRARGIHHLSTWATSFRLGAARRIVEKLRDRREQTLAAERQRKRAAERAATGASTGTALALSVYIDVETDANLDFVYGDGWSAGQAAKRAQRAAERAAREAEEAAWAAAHPEEAAEQERLRQEESERISRKSRSRKRRGGPSRDWGAFYTGYDAAADIGIDDQIPGGGQTPRLRLAGGRS